MLRSFKPADNDDVAECIRRAQQGCAESFAQLMRRFQVPLLHFLRQRAPAADAEDLLQETFLRAYANLHRYQLRWPFSTWLFTLARRLNANYLRRRRAATAVGEDVLEWDSVVAEDCSPLERMVQDERRRRLWAVAANVLTEEQFTALWLFYVEELPIDELAAVLGRTAAAVKVILFRARKKLVPYLAEFNGDSITSEKERISAQGVGKRSEAKP